MTEFVTSALGVLTVIAQIGIAVGLLAYLFPKNESAGQLIRFVAKYAFPISFLAAFLATAGSLYYSEIAGYNPCKFCWFQRIFMYPQVLLIGFAWWRKEFFMSFYATLLSAIGAVIAFYHYLLQRGVVPEVPCSAVGISEACSQRFVMELGYITIPLMACTAFLVILGAMLAYRRVHSSQS